MQVEASFLSLELLIVAAYKKKKNGTSLLRLPYNCGEKTWLESR